MNHRWTPLIGLVTAMTVGCTVTSMVAKSPTPRRQQPTAVVPTPASRTDPPKQAGDDATPRGDSFAELGSRFADASVLSRQRGQASYYSDALAGQKMANGRAYDPNQPTMAHRTLPLGTVVRVTRISTGTEIILQVADRGPFGKKRRIADLSREAARRLDMIRDGVIDVRLDVLSLQP